MKMDSRLKTLDSKLTEEEVLHVAKLAKLDLTPAEVKKFRQQLSDVLSYVGQLQKVDTSKVSETSQVTGLENALRPDKVSLKKTLPVSEALTNAPEKTADYFKVKAILAPK